MSHLPGRNGCARGSSADARSTGSWRSCPTCAGNVFADERIEATLRRSLRYFEERFDLKGLASRLRDSRPFPQLQTGPAWLCVFWLFVFRIPSFNAWEGFAKVRRRALTKLLGGAFPGVDDLGYVFERMDCDALRKEIRNLAAQLKRKKVLMSARIGGFLAVAVDGHELGASYKRCCSSCLTRRVGTGEEERIQYYHRVVVLTVILAWIRIPLDLEWVRKGEDEVAAAVRLIRRFHASSPKFFQIIAGDGLYAQAPFINAMVALGKHVVAVLKNEERELFQEVRRLIPLQNPVTRQEGRTTFRLWDFSHLTAWEGLQCPIRVVVSHEVTRKRKRVGKKWIVRVEETTWYWVTTIPAGLIDAWGICRIGHGRWEVENQGFNDWVTHWGFDHIFHHEPVALDAILLTFFIAYIMFRAFRERNLKPEARRRWSARDLALEIRYAFAADSRSGFDTS